MNPTRYNQLTAGQRETVIDIYHSLVHRHSKNKVAEWFLKNNPWLDVYDQCEVMDWHVLDTYQLMVFITHFATQNL